MRKAVSFLLCLVFVLCLFIPTSLAASPEPDDPDPIDPDEYTRVTMIYAGLSINSDGVALCSGSVYPTYSTDTVTLTVRLQYQSGSSWYTYRSWSVTTSAIQINLDENATVSPYHTTYRVRVSAECVAASGGASETVYLNSPIKTYP